MLIGTLGPESRYRTSLTCLYTTIHPSLSLRVYKQRLSPHLNAPTHPIQPSPSPLPFPSTSTPFPNLYILRICVSPIYFSRPESKCSHHSKSMVSQIRRNHGVKLSLGSASMARSSVGETHFVSRTSFGLMASVTDAEVKRM